jgi:hypothetical protein
MPAEHLGNLGEKGFGSVPELRPMDNVHRQTVTVPTFKVGARVGDRFHWWDNGASAGKVESLKLIAPECLEHYSIKALLPALRKCALHRRPELGGKYCQVFVHSWCTSMHSCTHAIPS